MTLSENCSIEEVIKFGVHALTELSDSAKLDVQVILCFVLDKELSYLLTWPENKLTSDQLQHFKQILEKRVEGQPVAHLVGTKEFWSLDFFVSPATLIPRPDTECLVELVLNNHSSNATTCLDLGTGTGAIALALASERPLWAITAIDFSFDAVALAQKNAENLNLSSVEIFQSNWFQSIDNKQKYHLIVSNPPYIDKNDEHLAQGDVRFEPLTALVAGDKGLADILLIIEQAREYLNDEGWLYFEHGYQQGEAVRALFKEQGYYNASTIQDYGGNDRITFAQYKQSRLSEILG